MALPMTWEHHPHSLVTIWTLSNLDEVVDEEVIGPDRYRVGSRLIPVLGLQER